LALSACAAYVFALAIKYLGIGAGALAAPPTAAALCAVPLALDEREKRKSWGSGWGCGV